MSSKFHQFIKPQGQFEDAQFLGDALVSEKFQHDFRVELDGKQYTIRRWNWDEAVRQDKWIKLSEGRCTLWSESKINEIRNDVSSSIPSTKIDPTTIKTVFLGDIPTDPSLYIPVKTGTFIDEFWSRKGGIMPGTITMVTGDPGIGKSSVMMDLLQGVKNTNPDKKVLYVSAEMTLVDMLDPDEFMKFYPGLFDKVEFLFAGDFLDNEDGPTFSQALEIILGRGYDIVVFDSMIETQSICQAEMGLGSGRTAEKFMLNLMQKHVQAQNESKRHTTFLLIQQVKKDGEFVGSRRLEHMITSFLSIKWDLGAHGKKYMEFRKNRRGGVKHRLYFKFSPDGIVYDIEKYQDELKLGSILEQNTDVLNELSKDELADLLTGKSNGQVEPEEMEYEEIED